jgi:Tfp pilus assembly protein PilV
MSSKAEEGGVLIEVIVSMVLLAILVTGLNASILSLVSSNITSKELSTATNNGYQLLEMLRRHNYGSITSDWDVINSKYLRSWTVDGDSTQKKIELTVSWPVLTPKHSISLSTIIARP